MKHIFFIDSLDKLNIKKDSSLMMALSLKLKGEKSYLLFEDDFYVSNSKHQRLALYSFSGKFKDDGFYLDGFKIDSKEKFNIESDDIIHMRIDPPYDQRYQRYLWMLDYLRNTTNCKILNDPIGIMKYNEKLAAFSLKNNVESFVGKSKENFVLFCKDLIEDGHEEIILKPMDLYSGIGVEKVSLKEDYVLSFEKKVQEFNGAIIAQPFLKEVLNGEYRSIYFDGKLLGSIIKRPNEGEFLTNIAQGAQFEKIDLPDQLEKECDEVAKKMLKSGVRFIAFDLLGNCITEINVTCPGLLVEVSYAHNKNFAHLIADLIRDSSE